MFKTSDRKVADRAVECIDKHGSPDPLVNNAVEARKIESPAALMFLVASMDRLHALNDKDVAQVAMETALCWR
jgi:hypothetical protein